MEDKIKGLGEFIRKAMERKGIMLERLAQETEQSKQIVSNYATSYRDVPVSKASRIAKNLEDVSLSYHAAEQAFGILNLRRSDDLSHPDDPFAISFVRDKEERERQAIEPIVFAAMLAPYNKRSKTQHEEIRHGIREMAEEISSELLYFNAVCEEEHLNALEMIEETNLANARR